MRNTTGALAPLMLKPNESNLKPVKLIVAETKRKKSAEKYPKKHRAQQMLQSQCQSRIPARSAIQLPDHSRHWKLLRLPLAGVIASQADRSSVTNRATKAIGISSQHQEDNIQNSGICGRWVSVRVA